VLPWGWSGWRQRASSAIGCQIMTNDGCAQPARPTTFLAHWNDYSCVPQAFTHVIDVVARATLRSVVPVVVAVPVGVVDHGHASRRNIMHAGDSYRALV
jgi:hypothetical protein